MASRRKQLPLPGIQPGSEPLEIIIPTMDWEQIGGDMDPGASGGTIASGDGNYLELIQIQPVREYVGDEEAKDVGFPFWTKVASFDASDLDPNARDVKSALDSIGMDLETLEADFTPEQRAIVIAEAMLGYGRADEGDSGWSKDIGIPEKVKWSTGQIAGAEYLADEDEAFRDDVLGWGEIKTALEEEVGRMVDQSAAEGWSYGGDQLASDIEDAGYDPSTIVIEADFGDAKAVNGDPLVDPGWEEALGLKHEPHPQLWSDVGTSGLDDWLEANGYEYLRKFGGRVPSTEAFAYHEHVISAVAEKLGEDEEIVKEAAESLDWWQEEIPGSSSGNTYLWAKRR